MRYSVEILVDKDVPEEQMKRWIESKLYGEFFPEFVEPEVKVIKFDRLEEKLDKKWFTNRAFNIAKEVLFNQGNFEASWAMQQAQFEVMKELEEKKIPIDVIKQLMEEIEKIECVELNGSDGFKIGFQGGYDYKRLDDLALIDNMIKEYKE